MRILVLGATGMMGHAACRVFQRRHEVFGTSRSEWSEDWSGKVLPRRWWVGGVESGRLETVRAALDRLRPDAVLNCIGIVKQLEAAKEAVVSIEVNSLFPHQLSKLCAETGAKLVHMSTDCVFSGRKGRYTEEDTPDPVDLYGRSKLLGEVSEGGALTLRTSIIGRQLRGRTGLVEWFMAQRDGEAKGFARAIYSGLTTAALAGVIDQILTGHPDLSGVWHVASEPINKFDLLTRLNEALGLRVRLARDETFVCDRSLDGTRFRKATGIEVPSWEAMVGGLAGE